MKNLTRLCESKPIVTINGKFPGPTLYAREDDRVIVRLVNKVPHNITIHWYDSKFQVLEKLSYRFSYKFRPCVSEDEVGALKNVSIEQSCPNSMIRATYDG